ncbi:SMI1/KNR4 family protein [Bacillus subtilis]
MGCCEAFKELFYYRSLGVTFPNDYKEFLLQHSGPEGYVLIRYHYDGRYVIDTNKSRKGLDYMLYLDSIDNIEDAVNLDSNFEIWFDMLVSFNGTKYWESSSKHPIS